jgi:hypothetical protein
MLLIRYVMILWTLENSLNFTVIDTRRNEDFTEIMKMPVVAIKPSALETLKSLASKKSAVVSNLSTEVTDPAIAGAKRNGKGSTVNLGFDPSIAEQASHAASLKYALDKAKSEFEIVQATMRDYGAQKRELYNNVFKTNVTTVCVPYLVETTLDAESATPGRETSYVQVICSNKYSVNQDSVLALENDMAPEVFSKLFTKETTKVLKANAEQLIRDLLGEMGFAGEELDNSMNSLFETVVKVKTTESYEQEIKRAPETVQMVLGQTVTRVSPGLKF